MSGYWVGWILGFIVGFCLAMGLRESFKKE